jgi:endonuclease G, mitochondrial
MKAIAAFIILLLTSSVSLSAQTACPEHFANGQAPDLINPKLTTKTRDICYSGYALEHSGVTRHLFMPPNI